MSLYPPPESRPLTQWTSMPESFRQRGRTPAWALANRAGQATDSFLEGPSFDRDGNLWVTDIPFGRLFRINTARDWQLMSEYDGWPNGLKIHRDGRILIADYRRGLLAFDPRSQSISPLLDPRRICCSGLAPTPPCATCWRWPASTRSWASRAS